MYKSKGFILAVVTALALQLLPAVASAQYAGGGIVSGPFSVGYVAPPPAPSSNTSNGGGKVLGAEAYNFTTNLHYGETGNDVTQLQTILIAGGYLKIAAPTGWFGPLTLAAVKAYQAANNIPATGFVGPLTRAELNKGTVSVSTDTNQSLASKVVGAVEGIWSAWESTKAQ